MSISVAPNRSQVIRADTCHVVSANIEKIDWPRSEPFVVAYQAELNQRLQGIPGRSVNECANLACEDAEHRTQIDEWCAEIINCCLSADHVFPRSRAGGRRNLSGWNVEVKPFKDECQFWYRTWCSIGRPMTGAVYEQTRSSKRQYMYAVRRVKRRQREFSAINMLEAIANSKSRDLFTEVKKMNPKPTYTGGVDDMDRDEDIAGVFRTKYEQLYNSVPSNEAAMEAIKKEISFDAQRCHGGHLFLLNGNYTNSQ
jgi:hypothetical protein